MNSNYNTYTFEIGEIKHGTKPMYKTTDSMIGSKIVEFLKLQDNFRNNVRYSNVFFMNRSVNKVFWVTAEYPNTIINVSGEVQTIEKKGEMFMIPIDVYTFTMDLFNIGTTRVN